MNIEIKIEEECGLCDGSGRSWSRTENTTHTCPSCDGVGIRLTDLGEQIITALSRYYKLELREMVKVGRWGDATVRNPLIRED